MLNSGRNRLWKSTVVDVYRRNFVVVVVARLCTKNMHMYRGFICTADFPGLKY